MIVCRREIQYISFKRKLKDCNKHIQRFPKFTKIFGRGNLLKYIPLSRVKYINPQMIENMKLTRMKLG